MSTCEFLDTRIRKFSGLIYTNPIGAAQLSWNQGFGTHKSYTP